jgi:hypothetical protein
MEITIVVKNPIPNIFFVSWYAVVPIAGVIKPIIVAVPILPFIDVTVPLSQQADFGS